MLKYALIILTVFNLSYTNDIFIDVTPYSSGKVQVPFDIYGEEHYRDKIVFSCGARIGFIDVTTGLCMTPIVCAGMIFMDTTSIRGHEYNENLQRDTTLWRRNGITHGMYQETRNGYNSWDKALYFPDSLVGCDSIALTKPDTSYYHIQVLYNRSWSMVSPVSTTISEFFNTVKYIRTPQTKLKVQISHISLKNQQSVEGIATYPDTLTFLWAADSLGNGIFKNSVPIKKKIYVVSQHSRKFADKEYFTILGQRTRRIQSPGIYLLSENTIINKYLYIGNSR